MSAWLGKEFARKGQVLPFARAYVRPLIIQLI